MKIDPTDRPRHIYMPGKAGSGKSTLLYHMAFQDIAQGCGVCLIDPHGDLVTELLNHIPKSRVDDVIYLSATAPVPLDFMGCESDTERDRLADDLMVMFNQFFTNTAGDRWQSILHWTVNTLLTAKGCTFLDIYYFLVSENKRRGGRLEGTSKRILEQVNSPDIREYWDEQFPHLPKDAATPIMTRMSKFLLTPSLKAILGSANPKLNVYDLMQERRVLLVNLANVGQESGNVLGTLIVAKIQQAAMRRPKGKRVPFYFYVDEFQHFQTSAFDVILSEARKYNLCLTLAHQFVSQLDPKIRDSIMGNVSTFIVFRLSERDALLFRGELGVRTDDYAGRKVYWHECLTTLPTGKAICRAADGSVKLIDTPGPPGTSKASYAGIIKKRTIERFSCPAMLEPEIIDLADDDEPKPTGRPKSVPPHKGKTRGA